MIRHYDNKRGRLRAPVEITPKVRACMAPSHVNKIQTLTTDTRRTPRAQFRTFNRLLLKLASTKADLALVQKNPRASVQLSIGNLWILLSRHPGTDRTAPNTERSLNSTERRLQSEKKNKYTSCFVHKISSHIMYLFFYQNSNFTQYTFAVHMRILCVFVTTITNRSVETR